MLARRPGYCPSCTQGIAAGDDIEKLCGTWCHTSCKRDELTRRIAQKDYVEVVPMDTSVVTLDQIIGVRGDRRRGLRYLKARQGL